MNLRGMNRYPFNSLLWSFALSYVVASLLAVIILEFAGLGYSLYQTANYVNRHGLLKDLQSVAGWFAFPLSVVPPDVPTLKKMIQNPESDEFTVIELGSARLQLLSQKNNWLKLVVTDPAGRILSGDSHHVWPQGKDLSTLISSPERQTVAKALNGYDSSLVLTNGIYQSVSIAAVPIKSSQGRTLGLLYSRLDLPLLSITIIVLKTMLLPATEAVALGAVFTGLIYGWLFSRRFTDRLKTFSGVTHSWSKGDFTRMIPEKPDDELGRLGVRLNQMAAELHSLLLLHQEVAAIDERRRMARELHDTVKQKMFAISMQLGAAASLIPAESSAALLRLNEAEKMAQMIQEDLRALLQELRSSGESICLAAVLKNLTEEWSWQTGIECEYKTTAYNLIPVSIANELTKVVNEALSNVARHSQALSVKIELTINADGLTLIITDDGEGFEPTSRTGSGMGLSNMRHRVESLPGGRFELFSQPSFGTRLTIECGGIHIYD